MNLDRAAQHSHFAGRFPRLAGVSVGRRALAPTLVAGGYPEAQRRSPRGRTRFFSSYIASIIGRDLDDIANVRNVENIERLLFVIAAQSGGLTNFHGMGKQLELDANTVRSHTKILEDLFLIRKLKPWHVNHAGDFVAMELLRQGDRVDRPVARSTFPGRRRPAPWCGHAAVR